MNSTQSDALLVRKELRGATISSEQLLGEQLEHARVTLDCMADGVICADKRGDVTYLNAVAERMTGWSRDEASGRRLADVFRLVNGEARGAARDPLESAVQDYQAMGLGRNLSLIRRDGRKSAIEGSTAPIQDSHGRVTGAVTVFRDVTRSRMMELELFRLAQHDPLTGLPNRALLNDRLNQAISRAQRHGSLVAVLFLDLDRFKRVNDSLGHAIGDKVLQEVAKRLTGAVRASDTVSRYGGDEFVIVLSELGHRALARLKAEKLRTSLSAPSFIGQRALHIKVSIGISIFPEDGQDAQTLIDCADFAMYRAKGTRRPLQFFGPR